ncbi:MAG TPA: hypothetical protein VMW89_12660 [Desulfatiglandales bacterium]|nr:hypothetical protein [Desulfatiglandales bacterium]
MVKKNIVITVLMLMLGVAATHYLFQNEEKRVKKQFRMLSKLVSKDQDEDNFTMARKARDIAVLFADNCQIESHISAFSGRYTRQEISGLAARARFYFSKLTVRFHDLGIDFPEKQTARVAVTGQASGTLKGGDPFNDEVLELGCTLRKLENTWLFTAIEVVEVLEE